MAKRKRRTKAQIEADKKKEAKKKRLTAEQKKLTAAQRERQLKKAKFLEIFPKKMYHIGKTCDAVGIHRNTLKLWRETDEDFEVQYLEHIERKIDDNEEVLFIISRGIPKIGTEGDQKGKLIGWEEKPDFRAIKLFLESQARNRGYGQRIEIKDDREDEREMSDEELLEEIKRTAEFLEDGDDADSE